MAGEWRETMLDQLGRIITGKTPPSRRAECFGNDIPFVTPTDMDGRRIIDRTSRYLTEDGANLVAGCRIPARAVMVSCIGSDMGKAAVAGRDCVTNQQINSIVVDSGDDPLFIYYNLSTRKAEIRAAAGGSAQPILNKSAFGRLGILLPSPEEQRAIAHILGTLDDKIELNRRMNETLEAMTRALFKSWFVDFDPVRARMEGRDRGLPKEIADLFPDCFEDSDLGEIPEGWDVRALYDCADYFNGSAFRNDQFSQAGMGLPIIKIGELKEGITAQAKFTGATLEPKYRITSGDILFSWSGSPDTSIDTFIWTGPDGWLNQHIFKIAFKRPEDRLFVYFLLHFKPVFIEVARDKQTTGLGHVTAQDLKRLKTVFPSDEVLWAFNRIAKPLFEKQYTNRCESLTLSALRDTLLPRLMSGELRVRDAERFIGRCA